MSGLARGLLVVFLLLGTLRSTVWSLPWWVGLTSPVVLAENNDDKPKDNPQPSPHEPRDLPQPRSILSSPLNQIQRDWRAGSIWVVGQNGRQQAIRVGIEHEGRLVGAVSLEPGSGEPIPYEFRNSFYAVRPLSQAQLRTRLQAFRSQFLRLRISGSGLTQNGLVQLPLLWGERLVGYVHFDPRQGRLVTNSSYAAELQRSPLKTR